MTEFSFLGGRSLTFNVLILTYLPIFIIAQTIKTIKSVFRLIVVIFLYTVALKK